VPFRRDCCQHCWRAAGQRLSRTDNSGMPAQHTDRDGRSWTMCPLLRIRWSGCCERFHRSDLYGLCGRRTRTRAWVRRIRAARKCDQPSPPAPPQPMNRIPAQNPRQPGADLPAGRHNHLIVVAATGLGAHRPYRILTT
jgi:hypothetical protein